jgi:hypothetical protein
MSTSIVDLTQTPLFAIQRRAATTGATKRETLHIYSDDVEAATRILETNNECPTIHAIEDVLENGFWIEGCILEVAQSRAIITKGMQDSREVAVVGF